MEPIEPVLFRFFSLLKYISVSWASDEVVGFSGHVKWELWFLWLLAFLKMCLSAYKLNVSVICLHYDAGRGESEKR